MQSDNESVQTYEFENGLLRPEDAKNIAEQIRQKIDQSNTGLIVDLTRVEHLPTEVLGTLVRSRDYAYKINKSIAFSGPRGSVEETLKATNMISYLNIHDTYEDAERALKP